MRKHIFLTGAALGALAALPAAAQTATDNTPADQQSTQAQPSADIVVTGTRAAGRTRLDTISPVDVLSAQALKNQGTTETAAALATVAPSIDFPRPAVTDATDAIRPATLRGLSPDQTLVLINSVRAHPSALLNINGSVGRGAAAVDLNTIPTAALESIEVLRDGASALYGSDAIAGVVNLRLRQDRTGGGTSVTFGGYDTYVPAPLAPRHVTDGGTLTVSGWQNVPIGAEGYLDVTGEYVNREPTSRGDLDTRDTPAKIRSRFGDPDVNQYTGYANLGVPLGDSGWQVVGWGGYQYRRTQSAAFPRNPSNTNNVPAIYPDGFLPLIQTKSRDFTVTGGVKGALGDWDTSLTASYGKNKIDYSTIHTLNATYGAQSKTSFYDGAVSYDQFVTNLDLSHDYSLGAGSDLTVAGGAEYRRESYAISAGEPQSYDHGPVYVSPTNGNSTSAGAQGFGGFSPDNIVSEHRDNISGYLDLEGRFANLSVGAAGRYEHYSDFGDTVNGKLSARYDFTPSFAIRGGIQTGFRAPSLQQQYFTSIASVVDSGNVILTGTFPSVSPVARALGGQQLEPEKSTNYSAGIVFRSGAFNLTADAYEIDLRNGLALSENIRSSFSTDVANLLAPYGVASARFFLNGVKSRTRGIDVVANYKLRTDSAGIFDFTVAGNYNDLKVLSVPETTSTLNPAPTLVSRQRIVSLEDGTPETKVTGTIDWSLGDVGLTARGVYYGDVIEPGSSAASDLHTGAKVITDIEARFTVADRFHFGFGADNLFDVYPDAAPAGFAVGVVAFPFYSPFGFNGRRLYVKAGLDW
ncbi:TonB-dependent receptor plug domain-containing protein [Stakelama marina]|uniref:TonB-dependent receptor n=1 Tax=Stakelama marina TaxID=2826939 RepID=A0A8T4IFL2_9SPHN|nr:TonB-dependent receptor [Stakelama marina]MBR0553340.1 TonB-dependent receptor [Stakelama marina]